MQTSSFCIHDPPARWNNHILSRLVGITGHYRDTRAPPSGTCGFTETAFLELSSFGLCCVHICVSVHCADRQALKYLVHYLNEDLID